MNTLIFADTENPSLSSLLASAQKENISIVHKPTLQEIKNFLNTHAEAISGVFINPKMQAPLGLPMVREVIQTRPETPLFFVTESVGELAGIDEQSATQLGIRGVLLKPLSLEKVLESLKKLNNLTPLTNGPAAHSEWFTQKLTDADFQAIPLTRILHGITYFFDLYVRPFEGRYLKILKTGDIIPEQRLNTYKAKNLQNLYILKEDLKLYLDFCQKLSSKLLQSPGDTKVALLHTFNYGEQLHNVMKNSPNPEALFTYVEDYVAKVQKLTTELKIFESISASGFFKALAGFEHGTGTTCLASMLAKNLGYETNQSFQIVGTAAYLHDISLIHYGDHYQSEKEDALVGSEKKQFWEHPLKSVVTLEGFKDISPMALQAIAQHHERKNRKGFPNKIDPLHLTQVAEIVGLCDELTRFFKYEKQPTLPNLIAELEKRIFPNFSSSIVQAMRKILEPK